jgi:hypothetical protein
MRIYKTCFHPSTSAPSPQNTDNMEDNQLPTTERMHQSLQIFGVISNKRSLCAQGVASISHISLPVERSTPVLKYDGPDVDGLERPELPDDYDELSMDSRAREIKLYYSMALMSAYRTLVHMNTPDLYRAIEFQDTTPGNLVMLVRRIFGVGEAHVRLLILNSMQTASKVLSRTGPFLPF